jgi:hypothetical protein
MLVSGPSMHPLDRPIWSALTTRQQALAEGGSAIALYRRQGMEIRRRFYVTVLHKRM